jgi:hypothetical protein
MLYRFDIAKEQSDADRTATHQHRGSTMACKTAATNEQAIEAFLAAKTEIDGLLAALAALSADHFHANPEEINWGHVGTANHIRERLQEVASFATGKG